tara:strand:+ start:89 stop:370 length:282 start_codon:yes stop_codon:yes gene_type:complete
MGILIGTPKYIIGVLLSVGGFIPMYIFGGVINTLFKTLNQLFSGNYIEAVIGYYITSALPPTSIEHVLFQAILGAFVAGILWFLAMARRGVAF